MKAIVKVSKKEVMKLAWDNFKTFIKRFGKNNSLPFSYYLKKAWAKIKERVNFDNGNFWSGINVEIYKPAAISQEGYNNFYSNTKYFGD